MATKRTRRNGAPEVRVSVETPETEDPGEAKTEEEIAADEVIEQAAGGIMPSPEAIIWRTNPDTGKEAMLDRVSASVVTADWLCREYGGGHYRVQYRRPNKDGKLVFGKQQSFDVDDTIPPKPPRWARERAGAAVEADAHPAPSPASSRLDAIMESGVLSLIQQMQQANQSQLAMFERFAARPETSGRTVEVVAALAPVAAAMMTGLIELLKNRRDPMEAAREIAALAVGSNHQAQPLNEVIGAIKSILEVKDMVSPPSEPQDPATALLTNMAPKLLDIIQMEQARGGSTGAAAPGAHVNPLPAGGAPGAAALPVAPQPAGETTDMPWWRPMLARFVPSFVARAQAGKDPELFAAIIAEDFPEQYMGMLMQFLRQPEVATLIIDAFPPLQPWTEWTTMFVAALQQNILPELQGDAEGAPDGAATGEGDGAG